MYSRPFLGTSVARMLGSNGTMDFPFSLYCDTAQHDGEHSIKAQIPCHFLSFDFFPFKFSFYCCCRCFCLPLQKPFIGRSSSHCPHPVFRNSPILRTTILQPAYVLHVDIYSLKVLKELYKGIVVVHHPPSSYPYILDGSISACRCWICKCNRYTISRKNTRFYKTVFD